jgi:HlyD family secretion protein
MKTLKYSILLILPVLVSCNNNSKTADAYGNFQAVEVIVSAETSGPIIAANINEGTQIKKGDLAMQIDSVQYALKVNELGAKIKATSAKRSNINAQAAVYEQQKQVALKDLDRIKKMFSDGAATQKQLDDINGQIEVINRQISSVQSNIEGVNAEVSALEAGIAQAKDMLARTKVIAPISGTILEKYAEAGEMAAPGKALFKIADLENMELKAYVSALQLPAIKVGQTVKVSIDGTDGKLIDYQGTISWISDEAEFTPKNIQTREERVSQVYAIKVIVKNDSKIKINMPAEVRLIEN